jgi:hypothetical protein
LPRKRPARRMRTVPGWSDFRGTQGRIVLRTYFGQPRVSIVQKPIRNGEELASRFLSNIPNAFRLSILCTQSPDRTSRSHIHTFFPHVRGPPKAATFSAPMSFSTHTFFFCASSLTGYHFWAFCAGTSRVDEPSFLDFEDIVLGIEI